MLFTKKLPQIDRMRILFEKNEGKEISAWNLVMKTKILHYTEVIRMLRNKGYNIKNRTERQSNGDLHSWYTYNK